MDDLNFSEITLPPFKSTIVTPKEISDLNYAKLRVGSILNKKSLAITGQTALITYIRRNWPEHLKDLVLKANQENISPEQLFIELLENDIKKGTKN